MHRFRLVTFDVIGTLLNFRIPPPVYYANAGATLGVEVEPQKIELYFKSEFEKMSNVHPNFGSATGIGWENWWSELVTNAFKLATCEKYSESKYKEIAQYLISAYKCGDCYTILDGTCEIIDYLVKANTVIGVISNYDERLHSVLCSLNLNKYFSFIITSYEAGIEKPSIEIFEKAIKLALQFSPDVSPDCSLHVGDKLETDYIGAIKAGWQGALISGNKNRMIDLQSKGVPINNIFSDLQDLRSKLPQLNNKTW